jgi:hypothetical protein
VKQGRGWRFILARKQYSPGKLCMVYIESQEPRRIGTRGNRGLEYSNLKFVEPHKATALVRTDFSRVVGRKLVNFHKGELLVVCWNSYSKVPLRGRIRKCCF